MLEVVYCHRQVSIAYTELSATAEVEIMSRADVVQDLLKLFLSKMIPNKVVVLSKFQLSRKVALYRTSHSKALLNS